MCVCVCVCVCVCATENSGKVDISDKGFSSNISFFNQKTFLD